MKIEKNFYDIMMQESDEIEAEIALEESLLSDEERKLQKEKSTQEAQNIINLANEKMRRIWHIHDKQKVKVFTALYELALKFAESNHMNILIETDITVGRIKLYTPFVHFGVFSTPFDKTSLISLIENADSYMIHSENNMLQLNFDFHLTTPLEK